MSRPSIVPPAGKGPAHKKRALPDDFLPHQAPALVNPSDNVAAAHELRVHGLSVLFPFEPYDCQKVYMAHVADALINKKNAMLESPTGTGKTLCLLSVLLAWQNAISKGVIRNPNIVAISTAASNTSRPATIKSKDWTGQQLNDALDAFENKDKSEKNTKCVAEDTGASTVAKELNKAHIPRILYASRTHAQLKQVAQELKKTPYYHLVQMHRKSKKKEQSQKNASRNTLICRDPKGNEETVPDSTSLSGTTKKSGKEVDIEELATQPCKIKACTLASREHYCLNLEVLDRTRQGLDINAICKQETAKKNCSYHSGCLGSLNETLKNQGDVYDLDDLKALSRSQRISFCPFYAARDFQELASIVFVPYIYLLNPSIRESLRIGCEGDVIVIDEAHNLESNAEEATSLELTTLDLEAVIDIIKDLSPSRFGLVQRTLDGSDGATNASDKKKNSFAANIDVIEGLIPRLEQLHSCLMTARLQETSWSNNEAIGVLSVNEFRQQLRACQLEESVLKEYVTALSGIAQTLEDFVAKGEYSLETERQQVMNASRLQKFARCLSLFWNSTIGETEQRYKILIREETGTQAVRRPSIDPTKRNARPDAYRVLCFWSFAPHIALMDLCMMAKRCHSLIITSGTLKPLATQASQLGGGIIPFPVMLENTHVIDSDQLFARIIGYSGSQNTQLIMSYQNLNQTPQIYAEVGEIVLDVCRSLPQDGVLVFFSSYGQLRKAIDIWRSGGIYNAICQWKEIFEEPSDAQQSATLLEDFKTVIDQAYGRARKRRKSLQNGRLGRNASGAVFLGVFRGRMSEGLSLSDELCRAVIIVGLPYPALKDLRVICKKQTLDSAPFVSKDAVVNGRTWYEKQASMAVNQAAGRVIRHRHDWGALLFVDFRYSYNDRYRELSTWITKLMGSDQGRNPAHWLDAKKQLEQFFILKRKHPSSAASTLKALLKNDTLIEDKAPLNPPAYLRNRIVREAPKQILRRTAINQAPLSKYFEKPSSNSRIPSLGWISAHSAHVAAQPSAPKIFASRSKPGSSKFRMPTQPSGVALGHTSTFEEGSQNIITRKDGPQGQAQTTSRMAVGDTTKKESLTGQTTTLESSPLFNQDDLDGVLSDEEGISEPERQVHHFDPTESAKKKALWMSPLGPYSGTGGTFLI